MALTITNNVILNGCQHRHQVWDKAAYVSAYLPWVDVALGIILLTLGSVASHGLLPMPGGSWCVLTGLLEFIAATAVICTPCCKGIKALRAGATNNEVFSGMNLTDDGPEAADS